MYNSHERIAGGMTDDMTQAEREATERQWDEADTEHQELIEAWKAMYRRHGLDPDTVRLDWDAVFESDRGE